MKKQLVFLIMAAILASCSSPNDVVSKGLFQKRKHLSGIHFNGLMNKNNAVVLKSQADQEKSELENPLLSDVEQLKNKELLPERLESEESRFDKPKRKGVKLRLLKRKKKQYDELYIHDQSTSKTALLESEDSNEGKDPLMTAAILSLIFAGISLMLITVPLVNIVFGVLALVLGRRAMKSENENVQMMVKIVSIAGLVLTILSVLYTLLFIGYIALIIAFSGGL